jgi:hypothetical protein
MSLPFGLPGSDNSLAEEDGPGKKMVSKQKDSS